MDFDISADHSVKIEESKKKDKYQYFAKELRKLWNMSVTVIPTVISVLGTILKGLESGLEELKIRGRFETIQTAALLRSTEKNPGDLWKLVVAQTPVKEHQLTLVWKICNNNNGFLALDIWWSKIKYHFGFQKCPDFFFFFIENFSYYFYDYFSEILLYITRF